MSPELKSARDMIKHYGFSGALKRARDWEQLRHSAESAKWWKRVADEIVRLGSAASDI